MKHTGAYIGMGILLVARLESFHHDLCILGNIKEFERIVILDAGVLGAGDKPVKYRKARRGCCCKGHHKWLVVIDEYFRLPFHGLCVDLRADIIETGSADADHVIGVSVASGTESKLHRFTGAGSRKREIPFESLGPADISRRQIRSGQAVVQIKRKSATCRIGDNLTSDIHDKTVVGG